MGSVFQLIIGSSDEERAYSLLQLALREIDRIESELSEFREASYTTLINNNAGIQPTQVSGEVFELLERCLKLSTLTQGAFDISVGPLKQTYQFKNHEFQFPSKERINAALDRVGYQKIKLYPATKEVFLLKKGMRISFAAIGKGYAADCVKKKWIDHGVSSGVINASGDLTTIGQRANGSPWHVGIAHPDEKDKYIVHFPLDDASVATSGDYEQNFMYRGKRYSHNLNPKTGLPIEGIKSVSVVSQSAELCDALATAVYVMGVEVGMHFLNQLPNTHGILIDDKNRSFYSQKIDCRYER